MSHGRETLAPTLGWLDVDLTDPPSMETLRHAFDVAMDNLVAYDTTQTLWTGKRLAELEARVAKLERENGASP